MKKILFYIDSLILGGEQKLAIDYIRLLCKNYKLQILINMDFGNDNFFLSKIPSNLPISFVIEKNLIETLNFYRKNRKNSIKNRILYSYYLYKKRRARLHNLPSIIKSLDYDFCIDFSNKLPPALTDERVLVWNHSSLEGTSEKTINNFLKPKYKKNKYIIVVSESMKLEYLKAFPEFQKKIKVVPNFIDIQEIEKKSLKTIPEKTSFFLCCSRLDPKKDISTIIRAFSLWKKNKEHYEKLFILGSGVYQNNLETLSKSLDLENDVVFLGQKENPYPYMKQAKLFLHASLQEGFGLVLVEAMACKTPVISTDCPVGPKEILENGTYGILIPMKDENSLYRAIQKIMENESIYLDYQAKAYQRAHDFSKENVLMRLTPLLF
ncbi:glycosyltransferase [Fusobacterium gonidiaformans]|nr:glycosyltransferase [Fusobacterium gonidiaformans]